MALSTIVDHFNVDAKWKIYLKEEHSQNGWIRRWFRGIYIVNMARKRADKCKQQIEQQQQQQCHWQHQQQ